jgi:hypothetical protein
MSLSSSRPSGSGKTTTGIARLLYLLDQGVSGDQILLLVPQRTLAAPYLEQITASDTKIGGLVQAVTVGGITRRTLELFWPLVAEAAGFGDPYTSPTFLTLETAQYLWLILFILYLSKDIFPRLP